MNEKNHSAASRYCEILRRHERMLRWLCFRHAYGDIDLADDYFQEVAFSLWKQLHDLSTVSTLEEERSYIKKGALFVLSHCSRKKHPDLLTLHAEMITSFGEADNGYDENDQLLSSLIDALPKGERITTGLYRAGYSLNEIALFLGTTPNAISQRLHRALARMRDMYEKECETLQQENYGK